MTLQVVYRALPLLLLAQIVQPLSADNNMLFRYIDMSIVANRTTRQPISLFMAGYSYEDPPTEKPFYVRIHTSPLFEFP